jgi:hypothetical protein
MLREQDLSAGKCYVNYSRRVARAILEASDKIVTFITYHLDTGNSCGSASECAKADFIRWADHEATPAEIAKLESHQMEVLMFSTPQSSNQVKFKHGKAIDPPTIPLTTSRAG